MLRRLQRAPIRQKLMLIAMLTTGGTLLLAGTAIIYFNVVRFKEEMKRDLELSGRRRRPEQHRRADLRGSEDGDRDAARAEAPALRSSPPRSTTARGSSSPTGRGMGPCSSRRLRPRRDQPVRRRRPRRLPPGRAPGGADRHRLPAQRPRRAARPDLDAGADRGRRLPRLGDRGPAALLAAPAPDLGADPRPRRHGAGGLRAAGLFDPRRQAERRRARAARRRLQRHARPDPAARLRASGGQGGAGGAGGGAHPRARSSATRSSTRATRSWTTSPTSPRTTSRSRCAASTTSPTS